MTGMIPATYIPDGSAFEHDRATGTSGDTTNASYTAWGPALSFTCPGWAGRAIMRVSVNGATVITGPCVVLFRINLAGNASAMAVTYSRAAADPDKSSFGWEDEMNCVPGAASLQLEALRFSGTGAFRADSGVFFSANVIWLPT